MATRREAIKNILDGLAKKDISIPGIGSIGSLNELGSGYSRGYAPASEDARSVLFKYRESLGLDEPPQAAEVASRSGILSSLREGLTAQGAPDPIGFNDGMLRERLEAGQSILDDPLAFTKALEEARLNEQPVLIAKLKALQEAGVDISKDSDARLRAFAKEQDYTSPEKYVKQITDLLPETEQQVIEDAAKKVKRQMKEQSVLKKLGYNIGAIASDINEDRSRSLYWLLNAPQAVTSTTADLLMSTASPNLRSMRSIARTDLKRAEEQKLLRKIGNEPLPLEQRLKLVNDGVLNPGEQGLKESIYLNPDNFEPAQPGIRRKFDKNTPNILRKPNEDGSPKLGDTVFGQRRVSPSTLMAAGLGGTALATNAGLGLTGTEDTGVPFVGRREGYAAASPDELDPRKSNNPAFELGTRYVLSRDGRLLPKDDFLLERPDVTAKEFANYQAYMHNKDLDFNPLDGKYNLGIIKGTNEGIHGPEVQILGQTLSANEAGLPLLGAVGGMTAGALLPNIRQIRLKNQRSSWTPGKGRAGMIKNIMGYLPEVRQKRYDRKLDTNPKNPLFKNPTYDKVTQGIEDFFLETNPVTQKLDMRGDRVRNVLAAGTFGGLAIGTAAGLQAEDQRRRENFAKNYPGIDYDIYKRNASQLLDQKYELMASDPNRAEKQEKSKAGFSRTAQQESLMNYAQKQQAVIDTIADRYLQGKAKEEQEKQMWALNKIRELEEEK